MPKYKIRWLEETYCTGIVETDCEDNVDLNMIDEATNIVRDHNDYVSDSFTILHEIEDA